MIPAKQKDNGGLAEKMRLRRRALHVLREEGAALVILETHGGMGVVYQHLYREAARGIVFEKDAHKAEALARQRPTWAVYEGDCVIGLAEGAGRLQVPTFVDIDPYGDPWPILDALLPDPAQGPAYLQADQVVVVVNDGLRQKVKMGGAWTAGSLKNAVRRHGNDLHKKYLQVCEEMLTEKAARAGYALRRFEGFYGGHAQQMTHYYGLLNRSDDKQDDLSSYRRAISCFTSS